jgi:hypothetical protein
MKNVKVLILMVLGLVALGVSFAQSGDVNAAVFVVGDNNVIQLGTFIETTPGDVPVSIYYHQGEKKFYYTWYSASKGYHILKAYDTYSYYLNNYTGNYYQYGYEAAKPSY